MEKNSEIKIIVVDIGGTLITDDNVITSEVISLFNKIKENGIKTCLATARMYSSTKYISNLLQIDYGIFANGAHVVDLKNKKTIFCDFLQTEAVKEIINYGKNNQLYIHLNEPFIETSDSIDYFSKKHLILNEKYPDNLKSNIQIVNDLQEYIKNKDDIIKVILVSYKDLSEHLNNIDKNIKNCFLTEYYKKCNEPIINKTINYIEYGNSKLDKAYGLNILLKYLGIKTQNVMAIADGRNDIGLFKIVGYPVAMENSIEEIKQIAKFITKKGSNQSGICEIKDFLKY